METQADLVLAEPAPAARLARSFSTEVTAHDARAAEVCRDSLPAGTSVYVALVPGVHHLRLLAAAAELAKAGFNPVPHVVARSIASYTQARDLLARLAGEAGVTRALLVGGDIDRPAGPFWSSYQLLETELFAKSGIGRIGLACYAEAHPRIAAQTLETALAAKLDLARRQGLATWLVTQFCFEPEPILRRVEALRAAGIGVPVRVGLAGPADRRTLWKYALHCGIGNSIRALGTRVDVIGNLLLRDSPDPVLDGVAKAAADDARLGIEGIHVFAFGGVAATARWLDTVRARSLARTGAEGRA